MPLFKKFFAEKKAYGLLRGGGKLAARFRRLNILLFTLAICIMAAVMIVLLNGVVSRVSSEYAKQYAVSTVESFRAHIGIEIEIISRALRSDYVIDWMTDEFCEEKMRLAAALLSGLVDELYSYNM